MDEKKLETAQMVRDLDGQTVETVERRGAHFAEATTETVVYAPAAFGIEEDSHG